MRWVDVDSAVNLLHCREPTAMEWISEAFPKWQLNIMDVQLHSRRTGYSSQISTQPICQTSSSSTTQSAGFEPSQHSSGGWSHSPLRRKMCRRSRTLADSGWPLEPSRETCPPRTCASCGWGTWTLRNHRSEEVMTTKRLFSKANYA